MKIYTLTEWEQLEWVAVYRDTVEKDYDQEKDPFHFCCVDLLIPKTVLEMYLFTKNLDWDYYEKESFTQDFDELYEFAKANIVAMRYCE